MSSGRPGTTTDTVATSIGVDSTVGDTSGTTDSTFITPRDFTSPFECDFWEQDCPRGQKCMPYNTDGGTGWNGLHCISIVDDPGTIGEPCTVQDHPWSGIDTCDATSMCFGADEITLESICSGFCAGAPDNPICEDPNALCIMTGDSVAAPCLASCDPLLPMCAQDHGCYPFAGSFICIPDSSGNGGAPGDPCEFIDACEAGTACVSNEHVPGCQPIGCCSSYCLLGDPQPGCLPGQTCEPYYPDNQAPPGLEHVGLCSVL